MHIEWEDELRRCMSLVDEIIDNDEHIGETEASSILMKDTLLEIEYIGGVR